jgi:hypothetical protein
MKKYKFDRSIIFVIFILALLFNSCSILKWTVPHELIGHWKSDMTKIIVRTESNWMKFDFTSDVSFVKIVIDSNKTVSGSIGSAEFKNAKLRKNEGNPEKTGVAYIVKCGRVGKIFPNDPLENKKVEIWLSPIKDDMHAELRYTESMAQFPMADLRFKKLRYQNKHK